MKLLLWLYVICSIFIFFPLHIFAYGIYTKASEGYDISFPQCYQSYPQKPFSFIIIGINGGKAFTQNPCLLDQFYWAKKENATISLYINLNFPSGKTTYFGMSGVKGTCKKSNIACQAYNYGYAAADFAFTYASSQLVRAPMWWIDIELTNSWSDTTALNDEVLQGAKDYLQAQNIDIGIYSIKSNWNDIMGETFIPRQNVSNPLQNWVVGDGIEADASSYCLQPFIAGSWTGLVQYASDIFDSDYACG